MDNIKVGILVNTHGLRGEVKVKIITDFWQERFAKGSHVYLIYNGNEIELVVEHARMHKGMLLVKFANYNSINDVEAWKTSSLYIKSEQLHELDEDEAYFHEIMDSLVLDLDSNNLGKVVEIIETGANLVLRVKNEHGQRLIPFVKAIVKEFNKQEKIMHVDLIEGL